MDNASIRLRGEGKKSLKADLWAIYFIEDDTWKTPDILEDYLLCQLYGCLPDELDRQDYQRVMLHWFIHNEIARIRAQKK